MLRRFAPALLVLGCFILDTTLLPQHVSVVDTELLDISSTEVRQRVACGDSIGGMVPKSIEALVRRLYGGNVQ